MPVYIATQAAFQGLDSIPFLWPILKAIPWLGALVLLKLYFAGSSNGSERNMHGKVVMVTVSLAPLTARLRGATCGTNMLRDCTTGWDQRSGRRRRS